MKCDKCGEKLNISPSKSVNFCSSCGNKIAAQNATEVIDNADTALRYIADNFGADILLGSKITTLFADVTKNQFKDERELIKILSEKGALECLKEAMQKSASEQEIAIKRAITKLPKFLQGSEDADIMLCKFAVALGWKVQRQETVQQPTQNQSAQPKQNSVNPAEITISDLQEQIATLTKMVSGSQGQSTQIIPTPSTGKPMPAVGSVHKFADIDWRVLTVENNKALLISEKILEKRPYNVEYTDVTWETCTLRQYLNGEFYNSLGAAKSAIAETRNNNANNQWYGTAGGNATTDRVFLLSLDEVVKYFGDSGDLRNKVRKDYEGNVKSDGYYVHDQYNSARIAKYENEAYWWWLRSPGHYGDYAANVDNDGSVRVGGTIVNIGDGGVRPALWLNL